MSRHDDIRDLVAVVALGAATAQEAADVERHAATCAECRAELDALRAATAGLALDVPQVDPPADLKKRVLESVKADRRPAGPLARAKPRRRVVWPALAGALAVLSIALFGWNLALRSDGTSERQIAITGSAGAPAATGTVTVGEDGVAIMRISGLPEPPPGEAYELWTIRSNTPRSEGFAARTADGDLVVAVADLDGASALAITSEPRTNTRAPTEDPRVVVPL